MSLFTLLKVTRTRHLLGKKQVPAGTAGAVKVTEASRFWYAYRRDEGRQIKVRLFTDKAASLTKLAKMNVALERGQAEMTDPRKHHYELPANDHLEEFIPVMRERGKSEKDKNRKEAVLRAFVAGLNSLADLTPSAVDRYLSGVKGSSGNRKKHLSAISVWVAWLLKKDRIASNPLDRVFAYLAAADRDAMARDAILAVADPAERADLDAIFAAADPARPAVVPTIEPRPTGPGIRF